MTCFQKSNDSSILALGFGKGLILDFFFFSSSSSSVETHPNNLQHFRQMQPVVISAINVIIVSTAISSLGNQDGSSSSSESSIIWKKEYCSKWIHVVHMYIYNVSNVLQIYFDIFECRTFLQKVSGFSLDVVFLTMRIVYS